DADVEDVDARAREPGHHGSAEELPGGAPVAGDDGGGTVTGELATVGEHVGSRHRQLERVLGRQVAVGEPSDAVGPAPATHDSRWRSWGAWRAFWGPSFLRSAAGAPRVRKRPFFSVGRLASPSISLSPRAPPSRSAPAWPDAPPPPIRAKT